MYGARFSGVSPLFPGVLGGDLSGSLCLRNLGGGGPSLLGFWGFLRGKSSRICGSSGLHGSPALNLGGPLFPGDFAMV